MAPDGDLVMALFWTDWWVNHRPLIELVQGDVDGVDREATLSSFFNQNGDCKLDPVAALLPPTVVDDIRATPFFVSALEGDRCVWGWDKDGQFSSKSAYGALMNHEGYDECKGKCVWIWKLPVP